MCGLVHVSQGALALGDIFTERATTAPEGLAAKQAMGEYAVEVYICQSCTAPQMGRWSWREKSWDGVGGGGGAGVGAGAAPPRSSLVHPGQMANELYATVIFFAGFLGQKVSSLRFLQTPRLLLKQPTHSRQ